MNRRNYIQLIQVFSSLSAGLLVSSIGSPIAVLANHVSASTIEAANAAMPAAPAAPATPTDAMPKADGAAPMKPVPMKPDDRPMEPVGNQQEAEEPTIAEITANSPTFKTLNAALKAAGLTDVLKGKGPFTVFAPTDKAFAALPKGTVESLLKPENKDKLIQVLTYHVVSGELEAGSLKSGPVNSIEGRPIAVKVKDKMVTVNDSKVTTADVSAGNGVIHVIDKVLIPPTASSRTQPKDTPVKKPTSAKPATKPSQTPKQPAHLH